MKNNWFLFNFSGLMLLASCGWAEVRFSDSYVMLPPNDAVRSAVAITKISNISPGMLKLVAASTPDADAVEFHLLAHKKGVVSMMAQPVLQIGSKASLELSEDGLHIMLQGLSTGFSERSSIEITFVSADGNHFRQLFSIVPSSPGGSEHRHH